MAPHFSTLTWKIPWTEEPGRLQSMGSQRVGHDWATSFHFSLSCIGEGNGTHSGVLAWRIPGTGEPGGLPSMGSHRVGHDWGDLAAVRRYLSGFIRVKVCGSQVAHLYLWRKKKHNKSETVRGTLTASSYHGQGSLSTMCCSAQSVWELLSHDRVLGLCHHLLMVLWNSLGSQFLHPFFITLYS